MGRRKDLVVPDAVRRRIQTSKLIDVLQNHIFGKLELSMSRIRAIEVLLRKTLPDLVNTTVMADINVRYVVHLPEPISRQAWLEKIWRRLPRS